MGMGFLVMAGTALVLFVVGLVLLAVVLLVVPGKKGRLSARRSFRVGQPPEAAWGQLAARLAEQGFEVDASARPARLSARRPQVEARDDDPPFATHARRLYTFDATLSPAGGATGVEAGLKLADFVVLDSGETAYLEWLMDRLVGAPGAGDNPPPTLSASLNGMWGLSYALTALAAGLLPFTWPFLRGRFLDDYAFGVGIAVYVAFSLATGGMKEAREKPGQVTNRWIPYLGLVVAVAAAGLAVWLVVAHWVPAARPAAWG